LPQRLLLHKGLVEHKLVFVDPDEVLEFVLIAPAHLTARLVVAEVNVYLFRQFLKFLEEILNSLQILKSFITEDLLPAALHVLLLQLDILPLQVPHLPLQQLIVILLFLDLGLQALNVLGLPQLLESSVLGYFHLQHLFGTFF